MTRAPSVFARTVATPVLLVLLLLAIAAAAWAFGSGTLQRTVVEMLIRVTLVTGIWIFVGNSGIISFGHIGFMCLGAYAAAWLTIPPMLKQIR
jgi:branched-chain amino acid transport system permease protein